MANLVKFYQTASALSYTQAYIAKPDDYKGALVFAADSGEIYLDGKPYGSGTISSEALNDINTKLSQLADAYVALDVSLDGGRDANGNFVFSFVNTSGTVVDSISIPVVTTTKSGVMSVEDKLKLDSIDTNNIVYKDGDKVLSSNDYTDEEKNKLASISEGAQPNTIETIKIDNVEVSPDENKTVNIDLTDKINTIVGGKISQAYVFKGSVNTLEELATKEVGVSVGDVYNITVESTYGPAGVNVAWTESGWDSLGGIFNTTNITTEINGIKQDITDINTTLDGLSGVNNAISNLETAVNLLNDGASVPGSVSNTATTISTTIIDEKLTWQTI